MLNFIHISLYSAYFSRLLLLSQRILNLFTIYFIYATKYGFSKFCFVSFYSIVYLRMKNRRHFSLLRSPHVNKKAQSQFSTQHYRSILNFQVPHIFFFSFYNTFFLFYYLQVRCSVFYEFKYKQKCYNRVIRLLNAN